MKNTILIHVDLSEIAKELSAKKAEFDNVLKICVREVANEVYENWKNAANNSLKSTRQRYIDALKIVKESDLVYEVVLEGDDLVMGIENGMPPFDMKPRLLGGKRYVNIPFKMGSPKTKNSNFHTVLPMPVWKIVKDESFLNKKGGLKQKNVPSPYNIPKTRAAISGPDAKYEAYTHKNSIYAGLKQFDISKGSKNLSKFGTFRRISAASDPNSWINKGIKAYNLMNIAVNRTDVDSVINKVVNKIL